MTRAIAEMGRVVVTGAAGMLGSAVLDHLSRGFEVFATDRERGMEGQDIRWELLDLVDDGSVREWLGLVRPAVVINCAAIVDVDYCERDSVTAHALHVGATATIARALESWNGTLIHISTDAVFDGQKRGLYDEGDAPAPMNVYARTKWLGEEAALECCRATVLRTNIFGWSRAARPSFAEWVLQGLTAQAPLTMFDDVVFTPINVSHLAGLIEACISAGTKGVFHATGSEALSKHQFALTAADVFGLPRSNVVARSVDSAELQAPRPKNMALSNRLLASTLGTTIPGAREGLVLMKRQRETGWVGRLRGSPPALGRRVWEGQ